MAGRRAVTRQNRSRAAETLTVITEAKKDSGMFEKHSKGGYRVALKGIDLKTRVYGEKTIMAEFRLKKDSTLPRHAHPHEQTGYLVKGRIRLSIGTDICDVQAGDAWCVPGGVEHGADIMEDSVAIEVFSPVREDYLPKKENDDN